jgi:hypothetical protein
MLGKTDYQKIYIKKWDECLEEARKDIRKYDCNADDVEVAVDIFEETANAAEIVGYYISLYGDDALRIWLDNTVGISLTEKEKIVNNMLMELYGEK